MERNDWGAAAFAVAGPAFAAYPALRPYDDGPDVWAQPLWTPAHLLGVLGFALLVPGLAALGHRAPLVLAGIGAALVLPYYGAEAFALPALTGPDAPAVAEAIRMGPYAVTVFGIGLLAVAAAGVAVVVLARRGGDVPVAAAAVLAVGLVLYLPQFFAPPVFRIAHGIVLGVGCVVVAAALRGRAPVARPA